MQRSVRTSPLEVADLRSRSTGFGDLEAGLPDVDAHLGVLSDVIDHLR
jgi:hypothetical protein